jgi:hypothetical protein
MPLSAHSDKEYLLTSQERRSLRIYQILVIALLILLIGLIAILIVVLNNNSKYIYFIIELYSIIQYQV